MGKAKVNHHRCIESSPDKMLRFFGIVGQRIAGVVIEVQSGLGISFQVVLVGSLVIKVKNVNAFSPLTSLNSIVHSNIFSLYLQYR